MKHLGTLLIAGLCLLNAACKKETASTPLTGKWRLTETYISTGGPGIWRPVTDVKLAEVIDFKADGVYSSSQVPLFNRYEATDSVTLVLSSSANASQPKYSYHYQIKNDTLLLSPTSPYRCIEGCASKYIKQRN